MITLDQVLLLEKKVENAVQKIEQLKAENDALRSKCAELTNALSAKTEQFSSFESDQNKIEEGILNALSRLSQVENAILDIAEGAAQEETVPIEEASGFVEHFDPPASDSAPAQEQSAESAGESQEEPRIQPSEELGGQFERTEPLMQNGEPSPEQSAEPPIEGDGGDENKNLFDIF